MAENVVPTDGRVHAERTQLKTPVSIPRFIDFSSNMFGHLIQTNKLRRCFRAAYPGHKLGNAFSLECCSARVIKTIAETVHNEQHRASVLRPSNRAFGLFFLVYSFASPEVTLPFVDRVLDFWQNTSSSSSKP